MRRHPAALLLFSLLCAVTWLSTSAVRADAVAISDGFCPPGLDHGVQRHSDACTPRACTSDAQCGEGAACHEIAECIAQESTNSIDGRVLLATPVMIDVVQGLCAADHTCVQGTCATRRQCEPTSSSAAWDPRGQRWTGTFLTSEPGHGCSVRAGRGAWSSLALGSSLLLVGLIRRRASRA